jgi:hypothetical protein
VATVPRIYHPKSLQGAECLPLFEVRHQRFEANPGSASSITGDREQQEREQQTGFSYVLGPKSKAIYRSKFTTRQRNVTQKTNRSICWSNVFDRFFQVL